MERAGFLQTKFGMLNAQYGTQSRVTLTKHEHTDHWPHDHAALQALNKVPDDMEHVELCPFHTNLTYAKIPFLRAGCDIPLYNNHNFKYMPFVIGGTHYETYTKLELTI